MLVLYRLQQRLDITRQESAAVLTLVGMLLAGLAAQHLMPAPMPAPEVVRAARLTALARAAEGPAAAPATEASAEAVAPASAPALAPAEGAPRPARTASAPTSAPLDINLNAAGSAELQRLRGIGPALAQRILDYRAQHGAFRTVEDIQRVRGIGPKTLAKLRPHVRVR
jgi:competence protein ComEA